MSINYTLQNFQGMLNYTNVSYMSILETAVAISTDVPKFYIALTTPQGMIFVQDIAQATSPTSITFNNFPLTNCGSSAGYTAAGVYYFYYLVENFINVYNCNTQTNTSALSIPGGPYSSLVNAKINIVGTKMYVCTASTMYQISIGAGGALTLSNSYTVQPGVGVTTAVGIDANRVFIGLQGAGGVGGGGYAVYNFATQIYQQSAIVTTYQFKELVISGGYVVGTNGTTLYQEPIASLFTDVQQQTSLAFMGIFGAKSISQLNNNISGSVVFNVGSNSFSGGLAIFNLTTTLVTSFLNQNAQGNQSLIGANVYTVTPDGQTFVTTNNNTTQIFKLQEKLYTFTGLAKTSQSIYRSLQGRIKILAKFPSTSATGTANLLDETGIVLDSWSFASGVITSSGVLGVGSPYCYFDAPLGMTNQSFQFQITSDTNEIVSITLQEVAQ